jgi:hypothetical protein
MQQTLLLVPPAVTAKVPAAKLAPQMLKIAVALNRGRKVAFPRNANAVRVTIGHNTAVILKEDADTLAGAGMATAIEFGVVRNDRRGHPIRATFEALAAPAPKATKPPKTKVAGAEHLIGQELILAL